MNTAPLVSSVAAGPGGVTSAMVGAPWWLTAGLFAAFALALIAVAVLQTLLPQESAHRLAWWRDRRHQQQPAEAKMRPGKAVTPSSAILGPEPHSGVADCNYSVCQDSSRCATVRRSAPWARIAWARSYRSSSLAWRGWPETCMY